MKKFLLLIAILFAFPASASTIPEGAIVKTASSPDVYIVKYQNGKQYRRLVLNPLVFQSYGHLKWENLLTISEEEMNSFKVSSLVKVDGSSDVYELAPDGDAGKRVRLESADWYGINLDSVYVINAVDFGNYSDNGTKHVMSRNEIAAMEATDKAREESEKEAARLEAEKAEEAKEKDRELEHQLQALEDIKSLIDKYNDQLDILADEMEEKSDDMEELNDEYSETLSVTPSEINSMFGSQKYYAFKNKLDEYNGKMKILLDSYARTKEEYDILIEKRNKLAKIVYEIGDFYDYGVIVPAADRAYLLSLGIDFQC